MRWGSCRMFPGAAVHGLSICTVTAGMFPHCRSLSFPKKTRDRMTNQQVQVQSDCFEVSPGDDVQVALKMVPNYCELTWTGMNHVPECDSEDLQHNIPACITGRISYTVHPEKNELSITVSDMLEDKDYHVRLCHKDFICTDTGANALIRREEHFKKAVLRYSRPLPCLCMEGWSAMTDANRVQVCPFENRLEELWFGVTFDPESETLAWETLCPVAVVISLCQRGEGAECEDLPNASQTFRRGKITYAKVDPHPKLCMKFIVGFQSWLRCPFRGTFQAWKLGIRNRDDHQELVMSSQISVTLSVGLCVRSAEYSVCQPISTETIHVEKKQTPLVRLTEDVCKPDTCVQVKRLDVKYAATILHCQLPCKNLGNDSAHILITPERTSLVPWKLTWVIMPAGVCLIVIIIATLVLHIMITVHQRRQQEHLGGHCASKKDSEAIDPLTVDETALKCQAHPVVCRELSVTDSIQLGSSERATLLSD